MARIQPTLLGFGNAQADIVTASSSFQKFAKPNMGLASQRFINETDKSWMGKKEWATQQFKSHVESAFTVEKYLSAEFADWLFPKAFGHSASGTYTPIDPGTGGDTEEVPYFSYVEQNTPANIDRLLIGCAVKSFRHSLKSGPGLANSMVTVECAATGKQTVPSGITLGTVVAETFLNAGSLTLTVQGVDYITLKNFISLDWGFDNAFYQGYFPGSGVQDGFQIQGRMEVGERQPLFNFSVRAASDSAELAKVIALTTGAATLVISGGTKSVTVTIPKLGFAMADNGETDGKVTVNVTGTLLDNGTDPIMSVTIDNT